MTDNAMHRAQDVIYGEERAAQMRKAPGLARIRAAVSPSTCPVLDQPVWKRTELGNVLDLLTTEGSTRRIYLDVPIAAVVGLTHRNFSSALTWRGMLADLHGFGWDERVIDYCESEIGHQSFPAPEAAYELRLVAYGGAVTCTNGVHRLVAAMNWLGATQGEQAALRKVSVRYRPADAAMVGSLRALQQEGARLCIGCARDDADDRRMWFVQASTARCVTYFHLTPGRCTPINVGSRWVAKARGWAGLEADAVHFVPKWFFIPPAILDAMARDTWIDAQIGAPRYEGHPD
ncbi:hypothetical protein Q3O97_05480 [Ralstonia pseudosolanacearum]|uniref:hypothetical protein n=1 Tax=Ralstonia pseudosolanacearum TaxID=1310165 RepID=UPI00270CF483|nr:hypothetical protein [Ralstonia pseudosolanacearum]MDO3615291.1 hypothetical protein [Ralstonia pseudosolanacearum]